MAKNSVNLNVLLYGLFNQTLIAVERARERARSDFKDDSRDWLRFFDNSQVLSILGLYSGSFPIDLPLLKSQIGKLRGEVHPQQACDNKTDLEKIRERLDDLVEQLSAQKDGRRPAPASHSERKSLTPRSGRARELNFSD